MDDPDLMRMLDAVSSESESEAEAEDGGDSHEDLFGDNEPAGTPPPSPSPPLTVDAAAAAVDADLENLFDDASPPPSPSGEGKLSRLSKRDAGSKRKHKKDKKKKKGSRPKKKAREAPPASEEEAPPVSDVDDVDEASVRLPGDSPPHRRSKHRSRPKSAAAAPDPDSDSDSTDSAAAAAATAPEEDSVKERVFEVVAHELVSVYPPTMVFLTGKTLATSIRITMAGPLVRDISSPLLRFKVRCRALPSDEVGDAAPQLGDVWYVMQILAVTNGPIQAATKYARELADRQGLDVAPQVPPRVTIASLRRALRNSNYFKWVRGERAKYIANITQPMADDAKRMHTGASSSGASAAAVITQDIVEIHYPQDGDSEMHWVLRNMLETAAFFDRANIVGGAAVRALGGGHAESLEWDMIMKGAIPPDEDGDASAESPVIHLLKVIHFANPLGQEHTDNLYSRLHVEEMGTEQAAALECIEVAAAIYHSLPPVRATGNDRSRNAIVWSDEGSQGWPDYVVNLLAERNIHVDRTSTQRWFACRQETAAFYTDVANIFDSANSIQLIRAEVDDDDHVVDEDEGGYIQMLRDEVYKSRGKIIVITKFEGRRIYLSRHATNFGARFVRASSCDVNFVPSSDMVVWMDRAHQFSADEILSIIRGYGTNAKRTVLAGSTISPGPNSGRQEATMFYQLVVSSPSSKTEVLSARINSYKVAEDRDPVKEKDGVPRFSRIVTRLSGGEVPAALRQAFPHAKVSCIAHLSDDESFEVMPGAIVVLDNTWTREDLAVVWQCTDNAVNSIWFTKDSWQEAMKRTARRATAASTLIRS